MFSPALGRAVRSTCAISTPSVCTATRPVTVSALAANQQTFNRRPHQRRYSSSNASIPPDNSNGSSSAQQAPGTSTARTPARKLTGRNGKKRSTAPALNVPHVPPTDYLQKPDVKISSFFSLHRPISVTSAVPVVSTSAAFDSIFMPRTVNNRRAVLDNIQTLTSGIESLEAALRGQETKHDEIPSEEMVKHLDGIPQVSVDQMLSQFVPFRPPPPPVPFDQTAPEAEPALGADAASIQPMVVAKKAWSATVVVTESTDAAGHRSYSASTSPMVEIGVPPREMADMEEIEIRQPFLDRMRVRDDAYNRTLEERSNRGNTHMQLISVKRQRKLKMKKHKYKKLMRKTRLLRRKLDRN
ncbi:hypothetical protein GQ43DRAFT_470191 [Delitschia confertaspora ATCC 74209]|uniref:Small ribosomal subunit protein mS38 n=1 Tax=Delitschia confertaspora ATCC 74209 TaxID=1513339 RepID=A0A9P4JU41_9PLEO|nr:hypothetical protein GQ43DRAFT_470191 [Delitschia confertaspora ATCC 74209]